MYIGNDGVVNLLIGLCNDCIELCKTDEITFEITLSDDNDFIFGLSSKHDLNPFLKQFTIENKQFQNYFPTVLKVVSGKFKIIIQENLKAEICFSFDKNIISETRLDYLKLSEKALQVALLNRKCEILTIDKRQKYLAQNYYHFPQGIFYLFERATSEVLGKPEIKLTFDNKVNNNTYQIGLAYRTDWYPTPNIICFANNVQTISGGSLVDGIIDGLVSACKTYVKENNLTSYKINRKKFYNGLIVVCAVQGDDFKCAGSCIEKLESDSIKEEAKKVTFELVLDYLKYQKGKADKFLWRFDERQLTSAMF